MKLYMDPKAPTDFRILVAAREAGLADRIEVVERQEGDALADLGNQMPLGALPELEEADGRRISGSRAICEYLDTLHERPGLMPREGEARFELEQLESFADDLMIVAVECERQAQAPAGTQRAGDVGEAWRRLHGILAHLDAVTGTVMVGPVTLGHIAVACSLDWIDRRLPDVYWRKGHPKLAEWYHRFSARPSMQREP